MGATRDSPRAGDETEGRYLSLESFRVRMYRSIVDSGPVPVFPLTALVGREESGKTSLLRALWAVHPRSPERYDLHRDWPRSRRHLRSQDQVVCRAEFRLSTSARAELAGSVEHVPAGVTVGRTYGDRLVLEPWPSEAAPEGAENQPAPPHARPARWLTRLVEERLPEIVYVDQHSLLEGTLAVHELAPEPARTNPNHATELQLLEVAELSLDELRHDPPPSRLRRAGEVLRDFLAERGRPLELALGLRRGRLEILLAGRGGPPRRIDHLPLEERLRLTLDVRLALSSTDGRHGSVLLLDGPGRCFRGADRQRLRACLWDYAASWGTLLYTNRLPFRMDLQHAEQVLVLSPTEQGTVVSRELARGPEPMSVRAVLGMTGRSSFQVGHLNLVVEGPNDGDLLEALSALLERSGEDGLPADLNVSRAGGSSEVVSVSTFLAEQGLGVIAFLDSDDAGRIARDALARAARDEAHDSRIKVLQLAEAAGLRREEATIEDLFDPRLYLSVARRVCGSGPGRQPLDEVHPPTTRKITAELRDHFRARGQRFPKGKVAEALRAELQALETVDRLPEEMLPGVRRLMRTIREAAGDLREHLR